MMHSSTNSKMNILMDDLGFIITLCAFWEALFYSIHILIAFPIQEGLLRNSIIIFCDIIALIRAPCTGGILYIVCDPKLEEQDYLKKSRKPLIVILIILLITTLFLNFTILFIYFFPNLQEILFSWANSLFLISITSFTSYIAFVCSIQFFRPSKRKTLIINIITIIMMLWIPGQYIVGKYF